MIEELENETRQLVEQVCERVKLSIAEKVSNVLSILIVTLLIGFFFVLLMLFLSLAATSALSLVVPTWAACLIVAAVDILLMVLIVVLRRALIVYPLINAMVSAILGRKMRIRDIELEKAKLEIQTERSRMRIAQITESVLMESVVGWVMSLLRKWIGKKKADKTPEN